MIHNPLIGCILVALMLSGCTGVVQKLEPPTIPTATETSTTLEDLPPPRRRIDVAVYQFEDLTGQLKPSEEFQNLSQAVSQGGGPILIKSLREAGKGKWFRVVERTKLNNLLQERRIVQEMRQIYLDETQVNPSVLPPMLVADLIVEGSVVGYDSNVMTGGQGAALLGVSARQQYRKDTLTVNLRSVSVKTGEILSSVVVQKSLLSTSIAGSIFRYVSSDAVLEAEVGQTENEPAFVALTSAIEKAVTALVSEMRRKDQWSFLNGQVQEELDERLRADTSHRKFSKNQQSAEHQARKQQRLSISVSTGMNII